MRKISLQGFTLIELVVVIALIGIVAGIGARIIGAGFRGYLANTQIISADGQLRVALERMQRDIRAIRSPASITTATGTSLSFTDSSGNLITYSLSGSTLMRQNNASTAQPLADGISSLTFSYYDSAGTLGPATANIRYIVFSLNVTQGNTNFTVSSGVYARNLQ